MKRKINHNETFTTSTTILQVVQEARLHADLAGAVSSFLCLGLGATVSRVSHMIKNENKLQFKFQH